MTSILKIIVPVERSAKDDVQVIGFTKFGIWFFFMKCTCDRSFFYSSDLKYNLKYNNYSFVW